MKSTAAMPVSSVVQADSFAAKQKSIAPTTKSGSNAKMTSPGVYRPRGPPKDQEMDDDSGSEAESGTIQLPKSVAEQRLKDLVQKRGIRQPQTPQPPPGPSKQPTEDDVPEWARVTPQPPRTAPIPLGHPYNLPPPAPPTTPRTTRRQMLSTELSESLRRNLLWERQITKNGTVGMKRSASGGGSRHNVLNGVQPFTGLPRVVQLHAKGTIPPEQQEDPSKPFQGVLATDQEREEMRKHAMARNRSWANDYHYAGW
ncbi:hypothetical protein CPB83DRAFT_756986 [Crepidotus variabilis]|uniref:DUF3295 domain-containing protein n=1 Tax=Crepidotus variabilis TaxID=179855 RepID=A0A9P6EST1_9AGAR|nr:hypothetical protein CPB83DRAFT_756986 [Crepidotus variabilis]